MCVGRHNSIPSENWPHNLAMIWNETDCAEKCDISGKEVQFTWHVSAGAMIMDLKKEFGRFMHGVKPESFSGQNRVHVHCHAMNSCPKNARQFASSTR